jgi:hypothetical protein
MLAFCEASNRNDDAGKYNSEIARPEPKFQRRTTETITARCELILSLRSTNMTATQTQANRSSTAARLQQILARLLRPADLTRAEAEAIGRGFHVTLLPPPVAAAPRK